MAAGGIISMFRTLPLIVGSIAAGVARPARRPAADAAARAAPNATCRCASSLFGSLVWCWSLLLHAVPACRTSSLLRRLLGAVLIVLFGFLFVTVSSRLTGEIGSSSNPISGMTVATLLLTCLIFLAAGHGRSPQRRRDGAVRSAASSASRRPTAAPRRRTSRPAILVGGTPR